MSPEQSCGKPLDTRSDVFSFGVTLYEALAGHLPFDGSTTFELMQSIIHAAPKPLAVTLPHALQALVGKALEKDPADRYQSMRELVIDFRRIARQSEDHAAKAVVRKPGAAWLWIPAAVLVVVLIAAVFLLRNNSVRRSPSQYVQLTNFADSATSPTLSPDGRMMAFIRGESTFFGRGQIYVKLLPDGEPVQLTNDDLFKMSPKFSLDGSRIAYTTTADGGVTWNTWIVPVLGGQPRPFLKNAEGLTWVRPQNAVTGSPLVLFSEMTGRGWQMSIVSSTESRTSQQTI